MALKTKTKFTAEEIQAGILVLLDPAGFARVIMGDKLHIDDSYPDIPQKFKGRTVLSHEQRMMLQDGADYAIYRWRRPEIAYGSHKMLVRTSRKTAKTTLNFELRYSWYSVIHPAGRIAEAMVHAPGAKQMAPVESRIERTIFGSPLLRLMFGDSNKEHGIWTWKTGLTWHHRIEGQRVVDAGHGMIGIAAVYMLGDEGAYSRTKPYNERITVALPDCQEVWCGVPREGETGMFKRIADTQWAIYEAGGVPEWSLHRNPPSDSKVWAGWQRRYHLAANPLYHSDRSWKLMMGAEGWDSTTVLTQVLGMEAEGGRSAFPNVVTAPIPFHYFYITPLDIRSGLAEDMVDSLAIPDMDMPTWGIFVDYGFSPSPMETLVAYKDAGIWYEYARLSAHQLDPFDAAKLVATVDRAIPGLASYVVIDIHGQGRGIRSDLIKIPDYADLDYGRRLQAANFETFMDDGSVLLHKKCKTPPRDDGNGVWFCAACDGHVESDSLEPARIQAKELLTGDLVNAFNHAARTLMGMAGRPDGDYGLVLAAMDTDAVEQFRETAAVQVGRGVKFIGPGDSRDSGDHITDAFRCIAAGERGGITETAQDNSQAAQLVNVFDGRDRAGYLTGDEWNNLKRSLIDNAYWNRDATDPWR